MAYINKKSAKRRRRGGVVKYVDHANTRKQPVKKDVSEAQAIKDVANDYTRSALENAISVFSRQLQEPVITLTTTSKRRPQNKRDGPTTNQIEKAQQKALKKALKEQEKAQEKAQKKAQKEANKAAKELNKVHIKVADDVTKSAIGKAFSTMFGKGTGAKSRRRK